MRSNQYDRKPTLAVVVATFVLTVFGVAYYAVAARLEGPASTVSIPADFLEALPLEIGQWMGQDVPMDEAIVRATDTDTHVSRVYSRRDGAESVLFFVGCSQSTYDRAIHRPEICYPRAGWTPVSDRVAELPLADGSRLPCTLFRFSRGDLEPEQTTVLHYYIVDGQPHANVSILQPRLWRLGERVDYVARVLIAVSGPGLSDDSAERIVSDFARDSAPLIAELFEDVDKFQQPNDPNDGHGER